jgi:predicted dehydrogenase
LLTGHWSLLTFAPTILAGCHITHGNRLFTNQRKELNVLRIGIIGYGARIADLARSLAVYGIPYAVTAVADPRGEAIKVGDDGFLDQARLYPTADDLLAEASQLDGVMIGTRCDQHTDLACKVAQTGLPLYLEKPVGISFEQVRRLHDAFQDYPAPTVVSFPLRLSPLLQKVKEIVESGRLGTVEHIDAFNDVPYGTIYFRTWYRDYALTGGLFLQKATHDIDYITYLLGQHPKLVAALNARRVFGGTMPWDLQCKDCQLKESCPESPFVRFRHGFEAEEVAYSERYDFCVFSEGFQIEDIDNCLLEYESGAQVSYTQNVFARYKAERRGARLLGYKGALEFDWYKNQIQIFSHTQPTVETIDFTGDMPHFGGDGELCLEWLWAMRDHRPSRSPIAAGILSALTCLWARESAQTHQFCEVKLPESP